MCVAPDGPPRVWIEVADAQHVSFDPGSATFTPGARPAWCADSWSIGDDCRGWLYRGARRTQCKPARSAPAVNGFQAQNVIEEGDVGVALERSTPGTAVPMAVGFDPKTKTAR